MEIEGNFATKNDINNIWNVIKHQDRAINLLLSENIQLREKLKESEVKIHGKFKDVHKNITGISNNLENLFPIVQDINTKYKTILTKKSRSPMRKSLTAQKMKNK